MDKNFMNDQTYYRVRVHRAKCPICSFVGNVKQHINTKILKGDSIDSIIDYIFMKHPMYSEDDRVNFELIIRSHIDYLDILLEDILTKSMFKSISESVKYVDLENLSMNDKLELIYKIEDDLLIEKDNLTDEKMSTSKALLNETLPLLISRFNKEIQVGKAQSIRFLSNSVAMTLDSITELTKKEEKDKKDKNSKENNKTHDGMELLDIDSNRKDNILSLSDRIQRAVGKGD